MNDDAQSVLERHLRTFVVPETECALGESGTTLKLVASSEGFDIEVECGFPALRAADALKTAILQHCAEFSSDAKITVSVGWSIQSHIVQTGLKPLEGV